MSVSMFVPQDGYSFTDVIPATPGLHPAVRFTYRPCTGPESRVFAAVPESRADAAACALIVGHVENATFTPVDDGKDGEPVVLTAETLKKLHSNIWNGIINRILGYTGPSAGAEKN